VIKSRLMIWQPPKEMRDWLYVEPDDFVV